VKCNVRCWEFVYYCPASVVQCRNGKRNGVGESRSIPTRQESPIVNGKERERGKRLDRPGRE
jgi:hypothetical protein